VMCLIFVQEEGVKHGDQDFLYSPNWRYLIYGVYYGLPFILGIGLGLTFKPLWRHFRNIVVIIFTIHLLYIFALYMLRYNIAVKWSREIRQTQLGHLGVKNFTHNVVDENKDGFVDKISFQMQFDTSGLAPGDYKAWVTLAQEGGSLPNGKVDVYHLHVVQKGSSLMNPHFEVKAQPLNQYFEEGPIAVDIKITKDIALTERMKRVLFFSRWAAFLKATSWEGHDPEIYDQTIEVQTLRSVGSFYLIPIHLPRKAVMIQRVLPEYSVDGNANGLMEGVVIPMEVQSQYDGPIYIHGTIHGPTEQSLQQQLMATKGFNRFEFVIKSEVLKQTGVDGPYQITDFYLTNQEVWCEGDNCPSRIKPGLKIKFKDYTTQPYQLNQME